MVALERNAPPERRGDRHTLSVDDPRTKSCLAALDLSGVDVADLRGFSNSLHRAADAWLRSGGFGERGRISKLDAELMWRKALAARPTNSLADYRRGGGK